MLCSTVFKKVILFKYIAPSRYLVEPIVRTVHERDIDDIYEIEVKCFPRDAYPKGLLSYYLMLSKDTSFVIEVDSKVVGYIIILIRWRKLGHVLSLAVDPQYRGKGYGRFLLREAIKRVSREHGVEVFRLEVRASNIPAIKLYKSLGFQYGLLRPGYYQDGEACYVMFLRKYI